MSVKQVIILSSISGGGKSTAAARLVERFRLTSLKRVNVHSADDFFTKRGPGGSYAFDPALLPKAHQSCFHGYLHSLGWTRYGGPERKPVDIVVVDNTNLSAWEIAPYLQAGETSGYAVRIVRIHADPSAAFERNTHGVPAAGHKRQVKAFNKRDVMPWWDVVDINSGEPIPLVE